MFSNVSSILDVGFRSDDSEEMDSETMKFLCETYVPGASFISEGVLRQLSHFHLEKIESLVERLVERMNSLLVESMDELDRVHGEVMTKRSSLSFFHG